MRRALLLALALAHPATAQEGAGLGGPGAMVLAPETLALERVEVQASGVDPALVAGAQEVLGLSPGDRPTQTVLDAALSRVQALPGVGSADLELRPAGAGRSAAVLRLRADPARPPAFPILWRGDAGMARVILNGGIGAFSDGNPWFGNPANFTLGNPLVEEPAIGAGTGGRATWAEAWVETGIAGVTRLGDSNFALYGAATVMAPISSGRDIFRADTRSTLDVEKAYAGLVWGTDDRVRSINLSFGRQNFTLNDGFLISQFGSQWNAGPRPGVYLAPRTTHDFAGLGTLKWDGWTASAFYLDPNEYEPLESGTILAGFNLRRKVTDRFYGDVSYIRGLDSRTAYRTPDGVIGTREGLSTAAGHLRWADPAAAPGLWLEGEIAHQRHDDFDMSAWAGYGTLGYLAADLPWRPSLSWRTSAFSGDDPSTARYERFDALWSGGLSEWLQGISLGKALRPENRLSHRIRLNLEPTDRLDLTFDVFLHRADELNNIGANPALGQLTSDELGREVQFTTRWSVSDNLYFLGVASVAFPGEAIRDATDGEAERWSTLQAQLFWTF
ncbi:alginate export family protein [Cereibacter sphaeroides]|uniref:alginate export family protein n=1 Tax=Cereibacter sphaeroides TaxID=1063 RepID=UPI001F43ACED|nr:alginate export family protein [Cereibacter sphaeroides]MCE6949687.1 alginate export family protein [Cereibacter sphaeroides]